MMKFLFFLLFLFPLCFLNCFWLIQFLMFLISFFFMLNFSFDYLFMYLSTFSGVDFLSFSLILLSFWVCSLMILASEKIFKFGNYSEFFLFILIGLLLSLFMVFISLDLFIFYLFFEVSLIPVLLLIIGWGYQPERIEAGTYLLFYTFLMSLPMMVSIFYYYENYFTLSFSLMSEDLDNFLIYLCMTLVFLVKMPMFLIHLWLPKAHVEAPVSGSMILAGIMLKLGGYGLMRLMKVFITVGMKINFIFVVVSLVGGFIVSLICICQSDLKLLIAYSSVAHMGLVLSGLMTLNKWGFLGALIMMLGHGLCSSGLFCLANMMYERLGSRSLYLNKGFINLMPGLSMWWFFLCSSNMAAPPSLNLLGEVLLINSLVSFSDLSMICLSLMSFFSAVYSLFLYSFTQHGKFYSGVYGLYSGVVREYLLMFLHWVPLNVLIIKSDLFVWWI
uniref:NADH-ubiquinone oxidoreductase chain 4 n=1 Tax=Obrium sp. NS-2015 TaxID=1776756 RepID=A0A0U4JS92_9CUCU|nr:NADH dehydrogenase subunit 4 [Obrium sp. NS-2015]